MAQSGLHEAVESGAVQAYLLLGSENRAEAQDTSQESGAALQQRLASRQSGPWSTAIHHAVFWQFHAHRASGPH